MRSSAMHRRSATRRRWFHVRAVAWFLVATLSAGTASRAQTDPPPRELRLASTAPAGSVWAKQLEFWAKNVEAETRGQTRLQLFVGSKLGPDTAVIQQIASGRIDMATMSLASASLLAPELLAVALPMQYRSAAEVDCVIDSGGAALMAERLARKGVHLLATSSAGTVQIVGRQPYREIADLAGLKAGTTGTKLGVLAWSALGANPVQVNAADQPTAFETGLIAVAMTAPTYYVGSGMNKLAPVLTVVDMYQLPSLAVINKRLWDSLSAEQRSAIERGRAPPAVTRQESREAEERAIAAHVRAGGQVATLSEAQHEAMRARVTARHAEMLAETGADGAQLHARIEELRRECVRQRPSGDGRTK